MIKPKTETTDSNPGQLKTILANMRKLNGSFVTIGVHSGAGKYTKGTNPPTVAEVALWTEFGTKPHGSHPGTPEYAWMRKTIDEHEQELNRVKDELLRRCMFGEITVDKALETLGFRIQVLLQNKIKSNMAPANAPSTQAAKVRAGVPVATLMNTTLLLRSIAYKVVIA